ncbi:hypothetical protein L6452_31772 [Arctium lappa]|uniref:Uncharacterized protein n=1 Tax=Arctium lappa TaxID=4217 RepID=A0ACB8Z3M9_ARCLA|nr:hypothetical protein L6452_31772 [Arctium lappa]
MATIILAGSAGTQLFNCHYLATKFGKVHGSRMQAQAGELNEKIEIVNREKISSEWKELCEKNIAIEAACVRVESYLEELKAEATKEAGISMLIWRMTLHCVDKV